MDGQHRRCLALLRGGDGLLADVRFQYLAARCLAATGGWEECLTVLGGWDAPDPAPATEQARRRSAASAGTQHTIAARFRCFLAP